MKRTLSPLIAFLGLVLTLWYLINMLIGFGSNPLVRILGPVLLAAAIWLIGAALILAIRKMDQPVVLIIGLLVLAILILVKPIFFEHEPWGQPSYLQNALIGSLLPQLLPCLGLIGSAILLAVGIRGLFVKAPDSQSGDASSVEKTKPASRLIALAALILAVLILAGGLYHLYWLLLWDNTYDPLGVIYLFLPILAVLFASALLAELQTGKRQWLGLGYAGLALTLTVGVFLSAKTVDNQSLTEARASRIAQALEAYHESQGTYPESLRQLTPGTMLAIPEPVIMHGQSWCYQGENQAYRLGYVDREHWSSPELYAMVAITRGDYSGRSDLCGVEIAEMKTTYPDFYGLDR